MIRIIYSADGGAWRDASPVKIDVRDLDARGRPSASLLPIGARIGEVEDASGRVLFHVFDHVDPTVLAPGDREFDHVLTDAERDKAFPGLRKQIEDGTRVAAARAAAANASHDDELAAMVAAGTLKVADFSDLAEINARRKLRGKPPIG